MLRRARSSGADAPSEAFRDDVQLIFSNCMAFNQKGSEIFDFAKDLQKDFTKLWKKWVRDGKPGTKKKPWEEWMFRNNGK